MTDTEVREPCLERGCDRQSLEHSDLCGVHFPWEPITIGPSWKRGSNGKFILPAKTLGYECLDWCYKYLQHKGKPWKFTNEQARIILWWYALDEEGEFLYSSGVVQRSKGTGKDYLIAAMSAFEMLGRCRFDRWDASLPGGAAGRRADEPWVQIAAVSQHQSRTTLKIFPGLFNERAKREYNLNIGSTQVKGEGGRSMIESVTAAPAALEGGRPSLFVQNETHRWSSSTDGHEMAQTGRANAGKVGGRSICFTNAYQPGQDSVAQRDREAFDDILAGRQVDPGIMYDSLEAPPEAPLDPEVIPIILTIVRGDSIWMPIQDTLNTILHPAYPPARARRFYYNQIVATDDVLVTQQEWSGCEIDEYRPLKDGDEVTLGLDGSKSSDATALVAFRLSDSTFHPLGIWEPSVQEADGLPRDIDMEWVDGTVARAFKKYKVRAFFSDVEKIESYVNAWSDKYRETLLIKATPGKSAVGLDMRGNQQEIVRSNEMLVGCIRGRTVHWSRSRLQDGPDQMMVRLGQHVLNCYQRPHPKGYGMSFGKKSRESNRKVDGYAAMLLAFMAKNKYLESGKRPVEEEEGQGWFW